MKRILVMITIVAGLCLSLIACTGERNILPLGNLTAPASDEGSIPTDENSITAVGTPVDETETTQGIGDCAYVHPRFGLAIYCPKGWSIDVIDEDTVELSEEKRGIELTLAFVERPSQETVESFVAATHRDDAELLPMPALSDESLCAPSEPLEDDATLFPVECYSLYHHWGLTFVLMESGISDRLIPLQEPIVQAQRYRISSQLLNNRISTLITPLKSLNMRNANPL